MTLIDLQGKVLYSGDKEVQKAYLGEQLMYKGPNSAVEPMYYGNPTIALSTMNGGYDYYGGTDTVSLMTPEENYVFQDNGLYVPMDDYIQTTNFPSAGTLGMSIELTFKMDKNVSSYTSSHLDPSNTNSGYGLVSYNTAWAAPIITSTGETYIALGGEDQYSGSTSYSKYVHDLEQPTTVHLCISGTYAYLYINGVYKGSKRQRLNVYASRQGNFTARMHGRYGMAATVYDLKAYDYRLDDSSILQNYQNIQARLQTI